MYHAPILPRSGESNHGPATSPNNLPRLHTKQDDEAKANAWLDANADVAALWFDAPDRQAGTTGRVGA